MNQLGFTGAWPPLELWDKYPNWEYVLDEEDWPGQVETTLRPSMNVEFIHEDVAYTAGDRRLLIPVIRPFSLQLLRRVSGVLQVARCYPATLIPERNSMDMDGK